MTVEVGLMVYLEADAPLAALVGTRLYPNVLPQRNLTLPAIVWQRIATTRVNSLSGPSGLATPRFQFTCWAATYAAAQAVAEALRTALDGYTGAAGAYTVSDAILEDEGDMYEPSIGLKEKEAYGVRVDYTIWHPE